MRTLRNSISAPPIPRVANLGRCPYANSVAASAFTSLTMEFRHDIPQLKSSWGVTWTAPEEAQVFYTGEILHWRDHALWGAYVEPTALAGFKATLRATAFNARTILGRAISTPPAGRAPSAAVNGAISNPVLSSRFHSLAHSDHARCAAHFRKVDLIGDVVPHRMDGPALRRFSFDVGVE
ncbi:hypothetical protein GGR40_003833 [Novosphingobium gossypii]